MQLTHQGSRFAKREEDGEDVCYISLIFWDLYILKLIWSNFLQLWVTLNFWVIVWVRIFAAFIAAVIKI